MRGFGRFAADGDNLVLFDQHKEKNTFDTIIPDLAESWTRSEDGKELTFKLRQGVNWHDGKPFTAADVKCIWDPLQGKTCEKLRLNPRKAWYRNLDEVTVKGDDGVSFHLKRPQPDLLCCWRPACRRSIGRRSNTFSAPATHRPPSMARGRPSGAYARTADFPG